MTLFIFAAANLKLKTYKYNRPQVVFSGTYAVNAAFEVFMQ
jgi:hypothetical protein